MEKMRNVRNVMLMGFLFLFIKISVVSGADYYVSTTGIDSNTGLSEAQAWRTIQKAANSISGGDTVHVEAGTYNEKVTISKSGTAVNPIIFQGEGIPNVMWTGSWYGDGPVIITGSYITIAGFRITAYDTVYDSSHVVGVRVAYGSGATNLNISNNYIWTQSGYGILLHENSSSNSVISNNEIHTGHQAAINLSSPYTEQWNIEITSNTIYADENKQHRDYTDASGIWTYYGTARNLNVSYNKILHSGYTAIKIGGSGH
ncbi:MAG: right-handed parallel beta-helix repeat-containing protein, partial [Candidatus Margulisiibacteriota bacterium]